jgi:hypothetical protein
MTRLIPYLFPLSSWVFILTTFLFASSQLLQATNIGSRFIFSYLDDLVVMPIILTVALVLIRVLFQKPNFEFPKSYLFVAFVYFSIYFEWWIPQVNNAFTSDWMDIVCYGIGTLVYFQSRKSASKASRF